MSRERADGPEVEERVPERGAADPPHQVVGLGESERREDDESRAFEDAERSRRVGMELT